MLGCVTGVIICNGGCLGRASFSITALLLLDIIVLLILVSKTIFQLSESLSCHWHGLTHTVHRDNIRWTVCGWKALKMMESCKPMPVCQVHKRPVRQ